ncbi:MAG: hypothetical protein KBG15_09930 [Kofleriaceae bacterium]|nr:hypothetical protein [Kofleriaceae bacterium]
MKLLVLAVLCVSSLAYADGTPDKFEFTAPAWPRNSEAEAATRGSLKTPVADGDLFVYTSANEETFATYYLSDVGGRNNPRDRITAFNRGVLAGAADTGQAQAKDPPIRSEGDNAISLAQHYALPGRAFELRVIATVDSVGILHAAFGLCAYPSTIAEPGCRTAVASLQNKWPIADRTPLDTRVEGQSQAYVMGKLVGKILVMVLVLGTISFLIRRKAGTPA